MVRVAPNNIIVETYMLSSLTLLIFRESTKNVRVPDYFFPPELVIALWLKTSSKYKEMANILYVIPIGNNFLKLQVFLQQFSHVILIFAALLPYSLWAC